MIVSHNYNYFTELSSSFNTSVHKWRGPNNYISDSRTRSFNPNNTTWSWASLHPVSILTQRLWSPSFLLGHSSCRFWRTHHQKYEYIPCFPVLTTCPTHHSLLHLTLITAKNPYVTSGNQIKSSKSYSGTFQSNLPWLFNMNMELIFRNSNSNHIEPSHSSVCMRTCIAILWSFSVVPFSSVSTASDRVYFVVSCTTLVVLYRAIQNSLCTCKNKCWKCEVI
jgi:hypothetical protein